MAGLHPHTCVYLYKCEPKKGDFHFNPCFALVRTTEGTVHPAGRNLPTQHLPGRKTLVVYFPHCGRIESPSTLNAGRPDGVAMVTAQVLHGSAWPWGPRVLWAEAKCNMNLKTADLVKDSGTCFVLQFLYRSSAKYLPRACVCCSLSAIVSVSVSS